ncbi:Hypothetical protein A7982_00066 [Minicystis rosea]|nr:Hypothetical protein A7982_00066 [Minicystis rosea]
MARSLRALALDLGEPRFTCLSTDGAQRLSSACNGFAELIVAGENAPGVGMNLRSGAYFLLSALAAVRAHEGPSCLADSDERWMIAEVESELDVARALFEARTGKPHRPTSARCG